MSGARHMAQRAPECAQSSFLSVRLIATRRAPYVLRGGLGREVTCCACGRSSITPTVAGG